jgi:hypothetical protein
LSVLWEQQTYKVNGEWSTCLPPGCEFTAR